MNADTLLGLVNNAALLLALAVLYETLPFRRSNRRLIWQLVTGILIGLIGIVVMLSPWRFSEGVVFDTRSILISLTGVFFGSIPTAITVLFTAVFRHIQGGAGAWTGTAVILTSAALGLACRYLFRWRNREMKWYELYLFGVVVHIAMLLWMLTLPSSGMEVLANISLPVMLIYPVGTVLLGILLIHQRQRIAWERALRHERDLLERIMDNSLDAILITSPDGQIHAANPAACRMFGRTEQELIQVGRNGVVDLTDPRLPLALKERELTGRFSGELNFLRKDGQMFIGEISSSIFKDMEGRERSSMIIRDVTDRKQAEEQIRQLNAELEQRVERRTRDLQEAQERLVKQERLAMLGRLAGGVSHELRNPLGVISNAVYFLNIILADADEKVKEYLDILDRESQTANQLISDLANYSSIQPGARCPVRLADLVAQTLARHPVPSSVSLELDFSDGLPMAYVDPRQIGQALGNLVVNAYQAMPEGGTLRLRGEAIYEGVGPEKHVAGVMISIRDTGVGILPEHMPKIFEPLFSTKPKGIGLGLVISKRLIEVNGGSIKAQSEPGVGAEFSVLLPVKGAMND